MRTQELELLFTRSLLNLRRHGRMQRFAARKRLSRPGALGNPRRVFENSTQCVQERSAIAGVEIVESHGDNCRSMSRYRDRFEAGRALASHLGGYEGRSDVLVFALPRGGVPVGFEVARALRAPLDVYLVRKLGVPGHEELAMGAVASGGVRVLNDDIVRSLGIPNHAIEAVATRELEELARRSRLYRDDRPPVAVRERTVILVDDGLATGATMTAAVRALRKESPARIVVAVPVAAADTCEQLRADADEVVCPETPEPFHAVGLWYEDFSQTSDQEVRDLLAQSTTREAP
jgi:putative phosphoribosyl transferase